MPKKRKIRGFNTALTPGEMYSDIAIKTTRFESGERKLARRKQPAFVRFCKKAHSLFPSLGKGAKFEEEYEAAVNFLAWDLSPEELSSAAKFVMFFAVLLGFVVALAVYLSPLIDIVGDLVGFYGIIAAAYIFAPFIVIAVLATYYIQKFPLNAASVEQTRALTYVPELVGYMTMSMKLVPNLEKAVEFSAEHGRGKIADDFKRLLWDVQLGVFTSLSEGLDDLAYRWGKFSEEFKRALMMIRASVLEVTEAKRYQILDKTMETVLESIKNKMEAYARGLSQPAIIMFYLGVLLPLILIIILPVGSAFSGQPFANPVILFGLYNVILPVTLFMFARMVISHRPPTYESPVISDNFPGLPGKGKMRLGKARVSIKMVVLLVLIVGALSSWAVSDQGFPPKALLPENAPLFLEPDQKASDVLSKSGKPENQFEAGGPLYMALRAHYSEEDTLAQISLEKQKFFAQSENDVTPYKLIFGLLITSACCIAVLLHYSSIYKRREQIKLMQMESEFKDSLYVLASRLGENKPVEEALKHTKSFLPGMLISNRIFGKTVDNIELMGMPLESAVFDPNYGALKNIPSSIIQSSMRILIDSVQLGVNVAARTLISMSLQLSNSEKVTRMLSTLVSDTTSMMKTMVIFVTPIVLGITTALQRVVMLVLSSIVAQDVTKSLAQAQTLSNVPGMSSISFNSISGVMAIKADAFASMVTPAQFIAIVALYVIELVIIMVFFTTKIEEDNNVLVKVNIAKALPLAVVIYVAAVFMANAVVGTMFGG